jgi:hypothetical protein
MTLVRSTHIDSDAAAVSGWVSLGFKAIGMNTIVFFAVEKLVLSYRRVDFQ